MMSLKIYIHSAIHNGFLDSRLKTLLAWENNDLYEFLTPCLLKAFYLCGIVSERIVLHEAKQETK